MNNQAKQLAEQPLRVLEGEESYGQIVESSSIMAVASSVTMLMTLVRIKAAAIAIGSTGVGLLAALTNIQVLLSSVVGLGLQASAVRELSDLQARGQTQEVGRLVVAIRRFSWISGLLGMLVTFALGSTIAWLTFRSAEYAMDVALLGLSVLFLNLSISRQAMLQAMRRISDLARINISTALIATVFSGAMYFSIGIHAVAPSLALIALCQFLMTVYWSRGLRIPTQEMTWSESLKTSRNTVQLGVALMWSSVIAQFGQYVLISHITSNLGLESTGVYSAANQLSGVFIGFVLAAMSADFFPRLASLSENKPAMVALINQQTEIGLLIVVPGLLATMLFAEPLVNIFYSEGLIESAQLLPWFVVGCFVRVISWPLGFAVLAAGKKKTYAAIETLFNLGHLFVLIPAIQLYGLKGGSIAYVLCYVGYCIGVHSVVSSSISFRWAKSVKGMIWVYSSIILVGLSIVLVNNPIGTSLFGALVVLLTGFEGGLGLVRRLGTTHRVSRILLKFPLLGQWIRLRQREVFKK